MAVFDFWAKSCDLNENNIILQSTYEYELIINGIQGYILWGIVFVVIAFLGVIGNIITIIVLKRDPIVTSLNILLIALAISDILAPTANVLLAISFYHLSNTYSNSINFLIFNDILRHIIQPLSTMFTMSSSWIVTATTLFRLIAVMWPFKARTLINKKFALFSLLIIFGFGLASIIPLYASLIRKTKCTRDNKFQYLAFDMEVQSELMAKAYVPTIQTMCFYLPWLIALTLWFFLLRSLRKSEKSFNISFVAKESSTVLTTPFLTPPNTKGSLNGHNIFSSSKRNSAVPECFDNSNRALSNTNIMLLNTESRISNAQTRLKSYNRITLMVVVLTFNNLICRLFTFVFIFEVIFNEYLKRKYLSFLSDEASSNSSISTVPSVNLTLNTEFNETFPLVEEFNTNNFNMSLLNARNHYPRFLSYSLLLNNIFLCINHSCNIVIYSFTNPRFRKNFFELFSSFFSSKYYFWGKKKLSTQTSNNHISHTQTHRVSNFNTNHLKSKTPRSVLNDEYHLVNSCEDSNENIFSLSQIFRCFGKFGAQEPKNGHILLANGKNNSKKV